MTENLVKELERHLILGADGKTMVYVYDGLGVDYRPAKSFKNYSYYIDDNGKRWKTRAYNQWTSMTGRANSRAYLMRQPTYAGVTTSEEFSDYDSWCNWAKDQIGFMCVDEHGRLWQLDKDLRATGNLHYSRDTVCFLPASLNSRLGSFENTTHEVKTKMFEDVYGKYFEYLSDEALEGFFELSKFDYTLSKSERISEEEYRKILEDRERTRYINGKLSGILLWDDVNNPMNGLSFSSGKYRVSTVYGEIRSKGGYEDVKEAVRAKIDFKRKVLKYVLKEFKDCEIFKKKNFMNVILDKQDDLDKLEYVMKIKGIKLKQWVEVDVT